MGVIICNFCFLLYTLILIGYMCSQVGNMFEVTGRMTNSIISDFVAFCPLLLSRYELRKLGILLLYFV